MEIIDKLKDHNLWMEFLAYKLSRGDLIKRDREDLQRFIETREYEDFVKRIEKDVNLSIPKVLEINKNGVKKKRLVFSFEREENYVLKMIAFCLKDYDHLFCDNLYSFRNDTGVKKAIRKIISSIDLNNAYTYKVDIHDYFNSINTDSILKMFRDKFPKEKWLFSLFENMLLNPYAIKDDNRIYIKKGVMAGTPTAGSLANLYLSEMDSFFMKDDALYARYSDDIIVFATSKEMINKYELEIKRFIREKELEINPQKEIRTCPGEKIEFLGFSISASETNVSDMAITKIKAKIKRKTRALYRWKIRKKASNERTAKALIRFLNNKFYNNNIHGEITWCRWYFPLITTDSKLKILDDYSVNCIRYLYTGKNNKKNYDLRYTSITDMGFRSLVNSFWKYKKGRYEVIENENLFVQIVQTS
ncbi:MAG: hypothetical protein IKR68_08060 [Lachnospiraceae bacterium]|nr:hypothetical protein [Lachnospiraceae bacterium]